MNRICLLTGVLLAVGVSAVGQAAEPVGKFPDANLTLSRWAGDPWTAAQVKAAEAWSVATGGKITVDAIPYENLHDKDALEMSNGTYDIMYVHPSWFGEFASSGALLPIDDLLANKDANPPGYSKDSFVPSVLSQGAYDGKQYCLPDFVSSVILAYRKDLLEAAGIAPPKSLADIVAAAAKLNGKDGIAGITLPGKRAGAVSDVMGSLITGYDNWWYDASGATSLDAASAAKALKFYADVAKYTPSGLLNFHVDEVATAAAQGQAAMAISTTPSLSALEDPARSKTVGKWGYAPLAVDGSKPSGELIYWNWCINAKSKSPEAAYSFLQYWTSGDQQAGVAKAAATAGATKDFYENKELLASLPFLTAMQAALGNANPQPSLAAWPKAQDNIELAVQEVIEGKKTPEAAADGLVSMLKEVLGK
jgi:ABC-type glycerol-3-phosphate transport system substrate-binding protein